MIGVVLILCVLVLLYYYSTRNYDYWKKKGVPTKKPWPIFGTTGRDFLRLISPLDSVMKDYNAYPNERVLGVFQFQKPGLMIKDPELIKQIGVKFFDHFMDHTPFTTTSEVDNIFSKNLFSLQGKKWRNMRATLSPAFTRSKMKMMFHLVSECGEQMVNHFMELSRQTPNEILDIEMKDMFTHFANDVIATSAFGIKVDSFNERDHEFYKYGKSISQFSSKRFMLLLLIPRIMKWLNVGIIPSKAGSYFKSIIENNIKEREEKEIIRADVIHLLMQAKKGTLREDKNETEEEAGFATIIEDTSGIAEQKQKYDFTNDDIVAQAMIFFVAGFETTSTVLSFFAYELAVNPDCQKTLQEEIDSTLEQCNGKIDYDHLCKMKYLDMALSESLRKWPPGSRVDRICTKDFILETPERYIKLKKGVSIIFPAYGLHHDPKYFPNPDRFDPERFSDENKGNINPYTYMPFGVGPRACVGSRFALMELKIAIFHILAKFDITVIDKTDIPLKMIPEPIRLHPTNGFWLGLKQRK